MKKLTRRTFMKSSAAAVAIPAFVPQSAFGASEKLNLAWVGFNNQGWLTTVQDMIKVKTLSPCVT
jgi:hypothetical protein